MKEVVENTKSIQKANQNDLNELYEPICTFDESLEKEFEFFFKLFIAVLVMYTLTTVAVFLIVKLILMIS